MEYTLYKFIRSTPSFKEIHNGYYRLFLLINPIMNDNDYRIKVTTWNKVCNIEITDGVCK